MRPYGSLILVSFSSLTAGVGAMAAVDDIIKTVIENL